MKRRPSARPFVVEIKRTRNAPTALTNSSRRAPPSATLWRNTPLLDTAADVSRDQRESHEFDAKAAELVQQPVRRILPSLTPCYVTSEPHQVVQREKRTTQRTSRAKSDRTVRSSPAVLSEHGVAAMSTEALPRQKAPNVLTAVALSRSELAWRRSLSKCALPPKEGGQKRGHRKQKLGRGEVWKRRLHWACW